MGLMIRTSFSSVKIVAVAVVALFALALAPAASAHTSLISATPEDGSVLTDLADLRLEFSEELLDVGNSAKITDAEGTSTDLVIDLSVPRVLSAPLPADLAPGEYVIEWRVVANDGHPLEDAIGVTYAPEGAAPTQTASPTTTPSEPAAEPSATGSAATEMSPQASPSDSASAVPISAPVDATDEDGSDSSVWWWIIAIGLVVGVGIGFVMYRAGRSAATPASGSDDNEGLNNSDEGSTQN